MESDLILQQNASQRQDIMYEWDLRWDLYKELGYPEIKNLDDMVDVLAQMKELCPTDDNGKTTYGVSLFADWDGDMVMFVKSTASAYFGYDEFGIGLYDSDKQEYHPCLEENGPYLTALKFYNTLYQKGLLDPDSQTQGYDGMVEDYQNGTAFMNVFNFLGSSLYNSRGTHIRRQDDGSVSAVRGRANRLRSEYLWRKQTVDYRCQY